LTASHYAGFIVRFLARHTPLKRLANSSPLVWALLAANIATMAGTHLAKLSDAQRRRLLALLWQARGRAGSLSDSERDELASLVALLEPRLFLGSATKRLSPVPVPKRLLYGPRGSAARTAATKSG
jgi:hypothetical protein